MWKILTNFTRLEKILVIFLTGVIFFTSIQLSWVFYQENTEVLPAKGGIYAEGMVGQVKLINPVFSNQNPIDADIVKLVFAGLMKYDANQKMIVDDLATHTLSLDQKTYTFTILENAYFHDGEKVKADDVVFTFNDVIKNPAFKNELLRNEFRGIEIKKIDSQTVTFTLPKPYKFFLTNLTIGILPKHLLFDLPIENLDQSGFNQNPIGAGPFKFNQILSNANSLDVHLKRFEQYHGTVASLDGMILKVYPSYQTLIKNLDILNGVRSIPKDKIDTFPTQNRFAVASYHLPQYVALFLNSDSKILNNEKVRLALQLATDRQKVLEMLNEDMIIDDPLMEIDNQNWIYQYDLKKASGGLYDAGWNLPEKANNKKDSAEEEGASGTTVTLKQNSKNTFLNSVFTIPKTYAETIKYITSPNTGNDFETTETSLYILGNTPENTQSIWVNNYQLKKFEPEKGTWSYKASTEIKTLKMGENSYVIYAVDESGVKTQIDEMKITLLAKDEISEAVAEEVTTVVEKPVEEIIETSVPVEVEEEKVEIEEDEVEKTEASEEVVSETETGTTIEKEEPLVIEKPVVVKTKSNIRKNDEGETLTLRLVTSEKPAFYQEIAKEMKEQWLEAGIETKIEVLPMEDFQIKVRERDYDVLLYGQSLGYNLDAYPYWHSSQVGEKGLNLANYASFESDSLMEEIRMTHNEKKRNAALENLQKSMSKDVPAIFLYRPLYHLAFDNKLNNIEINDLPTISDRFANIEEWHLKEDRFFDEGKGWKDIWSWIIENAWKFR